jgi:hypothetical protein
MNTSKRKFQTLLNGLGARSSTTVNEVNSAEAVKGTVLPRTSTDETSRLKRRRTTSSEHNATYTAVANSSTVKSISSNSTTMKDVPTASSPRPVKKSGTQSETASATSIVSSRVKALGSQHAALTQYGSENKTATTYVPSDRGAFQKRLASFANISNFGAKPSEIDSVAWAKRGWRLQKKETVRCVSCYKEVVIKLNSESTTSIETQASAAVEIGS